MAHITIYQVFTDSCRPLWAAFINSLSYIFAKIYEQPLNRKKKYAKHTWILTFPLHKKPDLHYFVLVYGIRSL